MRITTAKQARQFIGQKIRYRKKWSAITEYAIIKQVQGKNILVDDFGFTDWLWLPNVIIETIEPTEKSP